MIEAVNLEVGEKLFHRFRQLHITPQQLIDDISNIALPFVGDLFNKREHLLIQINGKV